jgi:hypothetical protein
VSTQGSTAEQLARSLDEFRVKKIQKRTASLGIGWISGVTNYCRVRLFLFPDGQATNPA